MRTTPQAHSGVTAVVLAKRPVPGRVKTRLTPDVTPEQAAELAAAALTDTLQAVASCAFAARLLSFDGSAEGWLPPGWRLHHQPAGGLDRRIAAALTAAGPGPVLLVGMDTPQLTPAELERFDPTRFDACLGPAEDGGYWGIGLTDPARAAELVHGVPMSEPTTGHQQERRLLDAGLRLQRLPPLTDVDTLPVAVRVAADAPGTAFARTLARLRREQVA